VGGRWRFARHWGLGEALLSRGLLCREEIGGLEVSGMWDKGWGTKIECGFGVDSATLISI